MKTIYKETLIILTIILAIALPALSDTFNPYTDIMLDYLPDIDYHPTVVLGEAVIIQNQNAYASPLLHNASSRLLDNPLGIYVNGVLANRLHRWDGKGQDGYVEIAIGGNGLDSGFSGYIDERHLIYPGTVAFVLPIVTLDAQDTEKIALRLDFSEESPVIATYPNGTQAQLLGYFDGMCHIQIGDQSGFVKTSQLQMSEMISKRLTEAMPKQFMNLKPVHKHIIEIGIAYELELIGQYGPNGDWPLWLKAKYADMRIKLGLGAPFLLGTYIMPSPDDLQQQQAIDIAARAASERFDIPLETLLEQPVFLSFFDADFKHTGHYWRIIFENPSDTDKRAIDIYISSPEGDVVDF